MMRPWLRKLLAQVGRAQRVSGLISICVRRLVIVRTRHPEAEGKTTSPHGAGSRLASWRRAAGAVLAGSAAVGVWAATTTAGTDPPELSAQQRRAAQKLYETKCAKCHKFYHPDLYGPEEWHTWMEKMRRKARLKPDQYELLSRYLDTFRTPPGPAPAP